MGLHFFRTLKLVLQVIMLVAFLNVNHVSCKLVNAFNPKHIVGIISRPSSWNKM